VPRGGARKGAGRKPKPSEKAEATLGRPSSYRPEFADQARKLCELGATDKEIADFFDIAVGSLYRWKTTYPDFNEALKAGKAAADDRVERSLYNRAVGYSYKSEKVFQYQGQIVRAETTEHVPPETVAAIFWLKNRRRDDWRDRQDVVLTSEFDDMTDAQLLTWIAERQGAMKANH
jgi:hypothetical protein